MGPSTQQRYLQNEEKIDTNLSAFVYYAQVLRYMFRSLLIIMRRVTRISCTLLYRHNRMHTIKILLSLLLLNLLLQYFYLSSSFEYYARFETTLLLPLMLQIAPPLLSLIACLYEIFGVRFSFILFVRFQHIIS
jgi:hypothetical protein